MTRSRLSFALAAVALLFVSENCSGQAFSGGFPFYMPPDDGTESAYLPAFPVEPITEVDFISTVGDDFFRSGEPIRFWGGNFVADGAFPLKSDADYIAARYRNMGFNLARFHHLDNPWSDHGIFPRNGSTRTIDEVERDRLEYLIYRLKQEGVYVNMNLHVSRTFTEADGVANADSIPDYGKGVTLFDPQLIDLQKEYAFQILRHANPYTGMALADDPVLAMVEIANENSLYLMWRNGDLTTFSDGGKLIRRHAVMLDDLWTEYLLEKYGSSEVLRTAWSVDAKTEGSEEVVDGGYEQSVGGRWQLEYHGGAQATVRSSSDSPFAGARSAQVTVNTLGPEDWRVQWKQVGMSLAKDSTYTVRFAARAEKERTITATLTKNVDPWTTYARYSAQVGTDWRTFEFTFGASESVSGDARISFIVGGELGSVWFDEVSMRLAGRTGMDDNELIETGTVRRLPFSEVLKYATPRMHDMTAFYIEIQDRYFEEMADYLRNEVGVVAPLSSTNWNFGIADLAVQSKLDYVDNHAYWDHPAFPNEPWSPTDWTIFNTSMVSDPEGSTIARLMAGVAMSDRPYTISEYNHAFPNRYQSEGVFALGVYAAFQDVDGLMFFDYAGTDDWTDDRIGGFFSIHRNPAMMSLMPSMARAYRKGLIGEADQTLEIAYSAEDVVGYPATDGGGWGGTWLFAQTHALSHRVVTSTYDNEGGNNLGSLPPEPSSPYVSDTGEIVWDAGGLISVISPHFIGFTGQLDRHEGTELDFLTLEEADGFATLTWIPLGDQLLFESGQSVITLSASAQNSGMVWDGTSTVHNQWGQEPVLMEPRRVVLALHPPVTTGGSFGGYALVHVLDASGDVKSTRRVDAGPDGYRIELDQSVDQTVWYGIDAYFSSTSGEEGPESRVFFLGKPYPNPSASTARLAVSLPNGKGGNIDVFDMLGRRVQSIVLHDRSGMQLVNLNLAGWAAGLYHIRLQSGVLSATRPLMVR